MGEEESKPPGHWAGSEQFEGIPLIRSRFRCWLFLTWRPKGSHQRQVVNPLLQIRKRSGILVFYGNQKALRGMLPTSLLKEGAECASQSSPLGPQQINKKLAARILNTFSTYEYGQLQQTLKASSCGRSQKTQWHWTVYTSIYKASTAASKQNKKLSCKSCAYP